MATKLEMTTSQMEQLFLRSYIAHRDAGFGKTEAFEDAATFLRGTTVFSKAPDVGESVLLAMHRGRKVLV